MGALEYVDVPGYAAILLRRTFQDLALPGALMARSHEWLRGTDARWNEQRKKWTFPSGATLTFGYCKRDSDVYQYQSAEFQYVGFDELTQFTQFQYTYLSSRLRRPSEGPLSRVPLRKRAASNPGGIGHGWVKQHFPIDGQPRGHRLFLPARLADNPHVDADAYRQGLRDSGLPEVVVMQLLEGDWGAFEGMAYPMFRRDLHVIDPFDVPDAWERFESMDFGVTNPTAWHITAVDYDGNLVTFDELYEPGLPSRTAPLLLERRAWWHPETAQPVCYADPTVFGLAGTTDKWGKPASPASEFGEHGIDLLPGNHDRVAGRVRLAELLRPDEGRMFPAWHPRAGDSGCPRWFVFSRCEQLIEQLESAPLEEEGEPHPGEAVSRKWERSYGHAHASMRYGALTWPEASTEPKPEPEDPRQRLAQQVMSRRDDHRPGARPSRYLT